MNGKNELEYLALIVQDYISKQDRSVQVALAEKAQHCVNSIQALLQTIPVLSQETKTE